MIARTDLEVLLTDNIAQNKAIYDRQNGNGVLMIKGTAAQSVSSGTYYAIQFVTDCTPTAFTATNSTLITSVVYPAGTVLYLDILTITCGSNEVYTLYKV
tara:strand:+ start:68 stop:367 length:300 start_codon:yes stop_codon:yes gene_type:complete